MKQLIGSLTLGLLVFFISFQFMHEEPSEGTRVLSTSESSQTKAEDEPGQDTIETTSISQTERKPPYNGITPSKIEIPSIQVSAPITKEGLTENGGMEVPDNDKDVGWFEPGTKPGDKGNAVLAGHVDSYKGPAVFFDLDQLKAGDEILIHGEDSTLTFEVKEVVAYPTDEAPINQIFGSSDAPSLNLITCTGLYDREAETHQERLVVYTEVVDQKDA
ncbi:hypothetical protein GCM10010954_22590 [Halobacillus andaensis]|uniref:Class F sortase n=1 Tax=Halobacillus andaensis TaxID=1176239 RepID=A0A917EY49_HALAA|nr:class F sortase [Halobacillus andaensis]MBP2006152.1 LPXTG-site transpeptidase (sortase) family protein [Halobacillus andaensis]GGF23286.1 hypothetical protein GCM10010954_22590 [Halobacillus andaensis]